MGEGEGKQSNKLEEGSDDTKQTCGICGLELATIPWNSVTSVTYCDNYKCRRFHTPVSLLSYKPPDLTPKKKKFKLSDWLDELANSSFSARIVGIRSRINHEEE